MQTIAALWSATYRELSLTISHHRSQRAAQRSRSGNRPLSLKFWSAALRHRTQQVCDSYLWLNDVIAAGVRKIRTSDVRALSRVRPAPYEDQSDEERQPRGAFHGDDAARPSPERRRRRAVGTHYQLRTSLSDRRRRTVQLHSIKRQRQTDDLLQT